ncbi:CBS-domain-containing membrane protein [Bradyrhizobium sp. USDA 4452]
MPGGSATCLPPRFRAGRRNRNEQFHPALAAEVKYCFEDQEIEDIAQNMGAIQVRRLPVLNRDKRLVGIIALGDIARVQANDGIGMALSQISRPTTQHAQL